MRFLLASHTPARVLFLSIGLLTIALGADKSVTQVEIDSRWGGLGAPQSFHLAIRADESGSDFRKIQRLVDALQAPRLARPSRENLGLTVEWLRSNAVRVLSENDRNFSHEAANLQRLQLDTFSNPNAIDGLLPEVFDSFHTDDYPCVRVRVTFADGSIACASSRGQGPYLLPWTVSSGARTYDARIALAVAALLPAKTVNRERLNGDGLSRELADAVKGKLREKMVRLDAENRAAPALSELRKHFSVDRQEVNPYHDPASGRSWDGTDTHETNLHVRLHRVGLPANLVVQATLLHSDGKTEGVEGLLARSAKYESLVTSTPWLMSFIRSHPKVEIEVLYVHEMSFGDHALETFTKDMRARGKPELVDLVRRQQHEVAVVVALGRATVSYWLLLPDHRMFLWRFEGSQDLLKWSTRKFGEPRCGDYKGRDTGCPGAEITPQGALVPEVTGRDEPCMARFRAMHQVSVSPNGPLFPVHSDDRGGFINARGEVVIPLCFDSVGNFSEGLAGFERNGRWGYLDRAGKVVIEPRFPFATEFSEGLAHVQLSGEVLGWNAKWGFVDKAGRVLIRKLRDLHEGGSDQAAFHEGLAIVGRFGKKGFIDRSGKFAISGRFGSAYDFRDGVAAVSEDSEGTRWGFIDKRGRWVIPPSFDSATPFEEGVAAVSRKGDCGFIDRTGSFVLKPPMPTGEAECATVWGAFHDGLARWRFGQKFGYIDHTGSIAIEPRFDLTFGFSEGLAAVQENGLWGYIDMRGKMVIPPRALHSAREFHNGLALVVTNDGKGGYLDRSGKYVWGPT